MEIQLVTMPELHFETGYGSKHGKWRRMGREKKNKRSFVHRREKAHCSIQFLGEFAVPGHFSITTLSQHCWIPALCHIPLQSGTWQQQRIFLKWIQLVSIASTHSHATSPKVSSVTDNFLKNMKSLTLSGTMTKPHCFSNDLVNGTLLYSWPFFLFHSSQSKNIPMLSYLK